MPNDIFVDIILNNTKSGISTIELKMIDAEIQCLEEM